MMFFLANLGMYVFPVILIGVPLYAWAKGVPVYETFVKGAEEGLQVVTSTLPYLIAIFVGISCFRGSGALELVSKYMSRLLKPRESVGGSPHPCYQAHKRQRLPGRNRRNLTDSRA